MCHPRRPPDVSHGLRLWGDQTGNCVRVAIALHEAGLPFETRRISLANAEHQSADFRALNPMGKVPVLEERGACGAPRVTAQTNAILLRISAIAPGAVVPTSATAASIVMARYFFFVTDVIAPSHAGFWLARQGDSAAAEKLQALSRATAELAETFAANGTFMAGDTFSLADIAAFTILTSWGSAFPWQRLPALSEWRDRVASRSSVMAGSRVFYQDDTARTG